MCRPCLHFLETVVQPGRGRLLLRGQRLRYVVNVFEQYRRILQYLSDHLKPVSDLVIGVVFITFLVYRLHSFGFEAYITLLEASSPVLAWIFNRFFFVVERWRAILRAGEGTNFICTGFPRSNINSKNFSKAFFSERVRYC